jgi:hypothetical protein
VHACMLLNTLIDIVVLDYNFPTISRPLLLSHKVTFATRMNTPIAIIRNTLFFQFSVFAST